MCVCFQVDNQIYNYIWKDISWLRDKANEVTLNVSRSICFLLDGFSGLVFLQGLRIWHKPMDCDGNTATSEQSVTLSDSEAEAITHIAPFATLPYMLKR